MRLATWNVNSVRQRAVRLLPWLDQREPDVVCLQELKTSDEAFEQLLGDDLSARGYEWVTDGGAGQWNGVGILSRVGLESPSIGFADQPGFPERESRAIGATCGGIRIWSLYVPNGREVDSDHYHYKLQWLAALRVAIEAETGPLALLGDFNIAPADDDVYDPSAYVGHTHVTPAERSALDALIDTGLHDLVRDHWPTEQAFSYWDYRAGMFHKNLGMRIDLVLARTTVATRVKAAWVDREARKGTGPSDHAPVMIDLDEAPDGNIGPVVPPPSRPSGRSQRLPQDRPRSR